MTREKLKEHCEKQIKNCEMWAIYHGEEPHGKVYEEHKLILELLEQEPILDKIKAEITEYAIPDFEYHGCGGSQKIVELEDVLEIIDKYKAEMKEGDA